MLLAPILVMLVAAGSVGGYGAKMGVAPNKAYPTHNAPNTSPLEARHRGVGDTGGRREGPTPGVQAAYASKAHSAAAQPEAAPTAHPRRTVMPYIYPVYAGYQEDVADHADLVDGIQYEAYEILPNGSLYYFGDGVVTSILSSLGVPAWPMIVNNYEISDVENLIYNVSGVETSFIDSAIQDALSNGYAGYSIDFEPPANADFSQEDAYYYIQFLNNFSDALHEHGLKLAVAVDPAYSGVPNSELYYYFYYPYTKLRVDYIMPMCYEADFSGTNSFQSAVESMLNAVGPYINLNQIMVLLTTTNPNTGQPFTEEQMSQRIAYLEQAGIDAVGVWSMGQPGGSPPSQNLWTLLQD